jgi:hypothetical protein
VPPQHDSLPQTGGATVPAMADRVTASGAHPAITGNVSLWARQAPWTAALKQPLRFNLGAERRAGTSGVHGGPGRPYEDDLTEPPYPQVTRYVVPGGGA